MKIFVTVSFPGLGRYSGGCYIISETFEDEKKARDYYTDCLVKYPSANVEIIINKK